MYVRLYKLPSDIRATPLGQHCPLAYNFLSMKLSITPAVVSGYSLRTTSSLAMKVFGWTKIFRGCKGILSQDRWAVHKDTNQFFLQNQIPDLAFPAWGRFCELRVEFLRTLPISCTLANLEFD